MLAFVLYWGGGINAGVTLSSETINCVCLCARVSIAADPCHHYNRFSESIALRTNCSLLSHNSFCMFVILAFTVCTYAYDATDILNHVNLISHSITVFF